MIFIVLGSLVLKIWPLLGGLSFRDSLFALTPPNISNCGHAKKRNGDEISNSQNFLVSMISTSILNKKKIHDIGCTPLFELGWNACCLVWASSLLVQFLYRGCFFFFFFLTRRYSCIACWKCVNSVSTLSQCSCHWFSDNTFGVKLDLVCHVIYPTHC